jgi:hypothetical protein
MSLKLLHEHAQGFDISALVVVVEIGITFVTEIS